MSSSDVPLTPSLSWRVISSSIMGLTGVICRGFLYGMNYIEVIGLERFLEKLDRRSNIEGRERGLITVSNHVSVIDDPLIWGVLPISYAFNPSNHRWSLGSYDICFQSRILATFFSYGQVLPTHRNTYSIHGGLFQPVMSQAIRLLSAQPFIRTASCTLDTFDPFVSGNMTYSTTESDVYFSPAFYQSRKHSWIHIFPEGRVHQHPSSSLRYFKWGISRLILESEPLPEVVPIFIDGNQNIMHENREFPEFLPRIGKRVTIAFGETIDGERIFGDLRHKWKQLVQQQKEELQRKGLETKWELGYLNEELKYGGEAVAIRKEVTLRVRNEVLKVRRNLGYPDEDPSLSLPETWTVK
ncbi:BgTH12-00865 [Blumeria graminis f. sp. triticale]|uniref:Tafazzin family protein n=1 Tax=Blumeria graminis f. sp. triticale TaxID=1689686 RepID=A0A9W4GH71_BLUGR|nr:BgTH12-00865 [Blumeria graminis f. sp. triticale]